MKDPSANRRLGSPGDCGGLPRRSFLDLAEHEGDALIDRKLVERASQSRGKLTSAGIDLRVVRRRGSVRAPSGPSLHAAVRRRERGVARD